ncbi:MAG TPA: DUF4235 domain-containing protein [Mycobacteriales bacterium]|nr:DUF4235 domain-containing protein [Mycobacteriales bacterium]
MSAATARLAYKPVGLVAGIVGGAVASAVFTRLWTVVGHRREAPTAKSQDYDWQVVLLAAALRGAVYSAVKTGVDRVGAHAFARAYGEWPG